MTLILNEVHILNGLGQTAIVSAADRLITVNGRRDSLRRKVFRIPYLRATVSYFGLAAYPNPTRPGRWIYFSEFVPNVINQLNGSADVSAFAHSFRTVLNQTIPSPLLLQNPSGFHICGYNNQNLPELWYVSNIQNLNLQNGTYSGFLPQYGGPSEDFLSRDARNGFGFDGVNPASAQNGQQTYRNGDIRAHGIVWVTSDAIFTHLNHTLGKDPGQNGNGFFTGFRMAARVGFSKTTVSWKPFGQIFCFHRFRDWAFSKLFSLGKAENFDLISVLRIF